jgi:6-phosphofructokinase
MNYESDIFLKDEGDIMTVCFQTPKALKVIQSEKREEVKSLIYGGDTYKKMDIFKSKQNKNQMIVFAVSHSLTIDNDLDFDTDLDS